MLGLLGQISFTTLINQYIFMFMGFWERKPPPLFYIAIIFYVRFGKPSLSLWSLLVEFGFFYKNLRPVR